jgi:hypothetical protein
LEIYYRYNTFSLLSFPNCLGPKKMGRADLVDRQEELIANQRSPKGHGGGWDITIAPQGMFFLLSFFSAMLW